MKITIIFLLVGISFIDVAYSQKDKAEVLFKDGTIKSGYGYLTSKDMLKFKIDKKGRYSRISFDDIEYAIIINRKSAKKYLRIPIRNSKNEEIVVESINGEISLYYIKKRQLNTYGNFGNFNNGSTTNFHTSSIQYYLKKRGEDSLININSLKLNTNSFSEAASFYFKDCSSLSLLIKEEDYQKSDIIQIINYYNHECN